MSESFPVPAPPLLEGGPSRLLVILGDQLDPRLLEHAGFEPAREAVVMMEVAEEATHVPSHKARTALFLSAMRHFALDLWERGVPLLYSCLDDPENAGSFRAELVRRAREICPERGARRLAVIRPGEWRVLRALEAAAADLGWELELLENPCFLTTPGDFARWAEGRRELILEYFYRDQRRRRNVLTNGGKPEGGRWNFDKENRKPLGRDAPELPAVPRFEPDAVTLEVFELVEPCFPDAPGRLESFAWPVTRAEALGALADFLEHRLPFFGRYQDAMRRGEPWLFHSLLSPALNLCLLDPREAIAGAVEAYRQDRAPLAAVEGFVRQILGWREFVRGVYWHEGPGYAERNRLEQHGSLPEIYWTGETDMACLAESLGQVLEHGYGHHIQRLMVTGNYALLAGVHPKAISDWYLGMYVDAVDWVTLPNTLGMVMHADGGVVGTKPYVSTGRYIQRMSDYCSACPYDPAERTGETACPFSTLYWDFLHRQRDRLGGNRRMGFAFENLDRLDEEELAEIRQRADGLRSRPA